MGSRGLLLLSGMFGRELDKHVFERRADFVDLRVTDPDATQLFVDLCALDTFIDQPTHLLFVGNVNGHGQPADFTGHVASRSHVEIGHDHAAGPFSGEPTALGAANAVSAAGDDGHFVFEMQERNPCWRPFAPNYR